MRDADEQRGRGLSKRPHARAVAGGAEGGALLPRALHAQCPPAIARDFGNRTRHGTQPNGDAETCPVNVVNPRPVIGLTMRDPAVLDSCVPVLFGDAGVIRRVREHIKSSSSSFSPSKSLAKSGTRTKD